MEYGELIRPEEIIRTLKDYKAEMESLKSKATELLEHSSVLVLGCPCSIENNRLHVGAGGVVYYGASVVVEPAVLDKPINGQYVVLKSLQTGEPGLVDDPSGYVILAKYTGSGFDYSVRSQSIATLEADISELENVPEGTVVKDSNSGAYAVMYNGNFLKERRSLVLAADYRTRTYNGKNTIFELPVVIDTECKIVARVYGQTNANYSLKIYSDELTVVQYGPETTSGIIKASFDETPGQYFYKVELETNTEVTVSSADLLAVIE